MPLISGGCLCDRLRFLGNSEPIFQAVCHCKNCQKQTGSAFRIVVAVLRSAVSMQGASNIYERTDDSGQSVINRFCPSCGTTVAIEPTALAEMTIIPAGLLNDSSWVKPTMEIYCDSAQPWVQLGGDMERLLRRDRGICADGGGWLNRSRRSQRDRVSAQPRRTLAGTSVFPLAPAVRPATATRHRRSLNVTGKPASGRKEKRRTNARRRSEREELKTVQQSAVGSPD